MATILGADGKPLMQEIASITRDINRVFYGGMQRNEDETLLSRGGPKGLKIYDRLKLDAHAGAVLAKRKLAVTSRPWNVQSASDAPADVKAAQTVKQALQYLRFNHICKRLLEATLKGYSVSEVLWELRDGMVLPSAVVAREPGRFLFDVTGALHLRTRSNTLIGEPMPERKFIVHRRGADDDSPYGTGIGGMLFWPVFFKRNTITFWLTFADKFGSPTLLGKYPTGTELIDQNKLLAVLRAVSQEAGVIVPDGILIEMLEAQRTGTVATYESLVRYMDEQISKAVLGETMSTTAAASGMGSNQASVQDDVRMEVAKDDADELCETLNETLVRWISEYNFPGAGIPRLTRDFSTDDSGEINTFTIGIQRLVQLGLQIPQDWVHDRFDIPRAADGMPALKLPAQAAQGGGIDGGNGGLEAQFAEASSLPLQQARGFNRLSQVALVEGAEALSEGWKKLVGRRVEDLTTMLESTGDLVQFREGMGRLLNTEPDPTAVETLARATFAAHVVGRGKPTKKEP